jgi:predicted ribosomally synthesized peptide with nif11-like leader
MSLEILEKVKDFLIKIVKDEAFRTQLMSEKLEESGKFLQDRGYNFSKEEFETAAIKILELKDNGEFNDLSEAELVGVVGGIASIAPESNLIQPLHGIILPPNDHYPKPLPKPFLKPFPIIKLDLPPYQAMYGVVTPVSLEDNAL